MPPEKIKSKLIEKKKKQIDIAKRANVSPAMVSMVISGKSKSKNVQKIIARMIGKKYYEVWDAA